MVFEGTVAVTGLNATDNPGPGVAVIRALRLNPDFQGKIIGLAYDAMEPGIYAADLVDEVYLIPYPSQGIEALRERIRYIHGCSKIDVIIPTLDSELTAFIELIPEMEKMGIGSYLPSREQLDLRAKSKLADLGKFGLPVPKSKVVTSFTEVQNLEGFTYPIVIKGVYYGAKVVYSLDEAAPAFHRLVAEWGLPIIVQQFVGGEELCMVAVGDGKGGLIGAVQMRKTVITDKGKGWAGVTIRDPGLAALCTSFMEATQWRGPCELEVIRDPKGGYHLLEINPRFPAWCYLSAGAGMNLPFAVMELAAGRKVEPMTQYSVGTMFVRIALDQISHVSTLSQISTEGEIAASVGVRT
jgi:carbamoyl-phosphate synthase large subunit